MTEPQARNDHPTPAESPAPPRRWRRIALALGVLAALAAAAGVYWFVFLRGVVSSDDARIDGNLVDVAPQIGGAITEVLVREGDTVPAGQVLFRLDRSALAAALARAQADVHAAEARRGIATSEHQKALHGPRAAEIRIALAAKESADAQAQLASSDWDRAKLLYQKHALTAADELKAKTAYESASRAQDAAADRLKLLQQGTRHEDLAAAQAHVEQATADVAAARAAAAQAQVNLDHAEVHAPFAGVVVRRWRDPGATVGPGTPVVTLLDPSTLHVSANIDEKDLADVSVGDRVDIDVDAYPGRPLRGRVQTILRATNSEFGLIPAEGVSGTFIKVAQRVPLRIALESPPRDLDLSPGLSVEIHVRIDSNGARPPATVTSR